MIKLISAALMLSGCALAGKLISDNQRSRCEYQRSIILFLSAAENRLGSTRIPFSELIYEMSLNEEYPEFLSGCSRLLSDGERLNRAWKLSVESDVNLKKSEALRMLSSLGNQLGATDIEGQLSCIGYCRRELEKNLVAEEEKSRKYSGVFPTLGILTGVWAAILFI